jgi:hypothetical protein
LAGGELAGDFGQAQVAGAAVAAEPVERDVHADTVVLGEHSFGLFDDDAAGEGALKLALARLGTLTGLPVW